MSDIVVPMDILFNACVMELADRKVPVHYRALTEHALHRLQIDPKRVTFERVKEDVREKLLLAGSRGCLYIPQPHCLGALSTWFEREQTTLFNPDEEVIPGSATSGTNGAFALAMRLPHMIQKVASASPEARNLGAAKGLVVESHVSDWFRMKWPEFWREPDNARSWERPCSHDFKLIVDDAIWLVDVASQKKNGKWGLSEFKQAVHFHLLCDIDRRDVIWRGVMFGEEMRRAGDRVHPMMAKSPLHMTVWLNCAKHGIDYLEIKNRLLRGVA